MNYHVDGKGRLRVEHELWCWEIVAPPYLENVGEEQCNCRQQTAIVSLTDKPTGLLKPKLCHFERVAFTWWFMFTRWKYRRHLSRQGYQDYQDDCRICDSFRRKLDILNELLNYPRATLRRG